MLWCGPKKTKRKKKKILGFKFDSLKAKGDHLADISTRNASLKGTG